MRHKDVMEAMASELLADRRQRVKDAQEALDKVQLEITKRCLRYAVEHYASNIAALAVLTGVNPDTFKLSCDPANLVVWVKHKIGVHVPVSIPTGAVGTCVAQANRWRRELDDLKSERGEIGRLRKEAGVTRQRDTMKALPGGPELLEHIQKFVKSVNEQCKNQIEK